MHQIELFMKYPLEVQDELFKKLITTGRNTEFGRTHGFADIHTQEQYRKLIPTSTYEEISPYIERNMKGEQNLLWPSDVKWFAKSSGTTNARSKFIPVSYEALILMAARTCCPSFVTITQIPKFLMEKG